MSANQHALLWLLVCSQKLLGLLFIIMTIVAAPVYYISWFGQQLSEEDRDALYITVLSIANVGFNSEMARPATNGTETDQQLFVLPHIGSFTESQLSMFITYSVLLNAIIYICFAAWFPVFIQGQNRQADEANITSADYAVFVRGLPVDTTEKELVDHFDKLYSLWDDDWTLRSCCLTKRKRRPKFQPDTPTNRARWANANLNAKAHRVGFKRNTADPVGNVDHLLDPFVPPSEADPLGWRRKEFEAFRLSDRDQPATFGEPEGEAAASAGGSGFESDAKLARERQNVEEVAKRLAETFPEDGVGARAAMFYGRWVADVTLVHPNGELLSRYLSVRKVLQQLDTETSRAKMFRMQGKERRLKAQLKVLDKLEGELRTINDTALSAWDDKTVVSAFVMFENEESRKRCLYDYSTWNSRCTGQAKPLLFRGKHALEVREAAEPDEIAWENMEVTDGARCCRQCLTALVALVLLVASLIVIVAANVAKTTFSGGIPATSVCATELPALHYGGYENIPSTFRLERVPDAVSNCSAVATERTAWIQAGLAVPGDGAYGSSRSLTGLRYNPPPAASAVSPALAAAAGDPRCTNGTCWGISDSFRCTTIGTASTARFSFVGSSVASCYCIDRFIAALEMHGTNGLSVVQKEEGALCFDLLAAYATAQSLVVGAALLVVVVNAVLKTVLTAITRFERHASLSDATAALSLKIFIAQFINTALIVLLVNAQFDFVQQLGLPNGIFGLFAGGFSSFVPRWYAAVGVGICITMLSNIAVPHIATIIAVALRPCRRCCTTPVDDDEATAMYALPVFDPSANYPVMINVVFVTMMYSSGLPVLLPVAAAFMWVTYWLDRCCLFRCMARPAFEGATVAKQIGRLLKWSVLLHLFFAVWMLSDASTLESEPFELAQYLSGSDDAQAALAAIAEQASAWDLVGFVPRMLRANTFPVFALLLVLIMGTIAYLIVGHPVTRLLRSVFWALTCGFCCRNAKSDHEIDELNPAFTKVFTQQVREDNIPMLAKMEHDASNITVTQDTYRGGHFKAMGHLFSEEDEAEDWRHLAHMPMRTWQVVHRSHAPSYHLLLHSKYSDAYKAIKEGMDFQAAAREAVQLAHLETEASNVELATEAQAWHEAQAASAALLPQLVGSAAPVAAVSPAGEAILDNTAANAPGSGTSGAAYAVRTVQGSADGGAPASA